MADAKRYKESGWWARCNPRKCKLINGVLDAGDKVTVTVLKSGISWEEAILQEVSFIAWDKVNGNFLVNMTAGGEGTTGHVCTAETKEKISAANTGRKMPPRSAEYREQVSARFKGRKHTDATKEKLRVAHLGKKDSDETREKKRIASTGKTQSAESRQKTRVAATGRIHSDESKEKNRIASTGVIPTQETKDKLSAAVIAYWAQWHSDHPGMKRPRRSGRDTIAP